MPRPWTALDRDADIENLDGSQYDLLIIGGGITGAGIARECALRNISFCLLDKSDFAFGTSSRSSKLFHGGMRYLARAEFGLVRKAAAERNWLLHHLPNLVRPLAFVLPSYENGRTSPFQVRAAVFLYDFLSDTFSKYKNYRKRSILSPEQVREMEPSVALSDPDLGPMNMAGLYYDTNCDDARVTLEAIKESLDYSSGQSTALNYMEVREYINDKSGRVCGVIALDLFSGKEVTVYARCVVSAAGIWTDQVVATAGHEEVRVFPTKGVHIVVPRERLGNINAFSLTSIDDGRVFFILPRGRVSIIGTTDTDYYSESVDLDQPWSNRDDYEYLMKTVNRMFPQAQLTDTEVVSAYAGIRPLIKEHGEKKESSISRKHEIFKVKEGLVAIAGGKSTIFRLMAEDLLFYLVKNGQLALPSPFKCYKRGYSKKPFQIGITQNAFHSLVQQRDLIDIVSPGQLEHLSSQYGKGAIKILEEIKQKPSSGKPFLPDYDFCQAEIEYILQHENAPCLLDVLCRRTEAQWQVWHHRQPALAKAVAEVMSAYYGWSVLRKEKEIDEYLDYVLKNVSFLQK